MLLEVIGSLLVIFVISRICRYICRLGKRYPPGPWGFPVLGHLPFFGSLPTKTFLQWRRLYGDIYTIKMGSWNTVVLNGKTAINEAMENNKDVFSDRPPFSTGDILKRAYGGVDSLTFGRFNADYLFHRKTTAAALRAFTHSRLASTCDLIIEESDKLVEAILKGGNEPRDIEEEIQVCVGSVLYQILYGIGRIATESPAFIALLKNKNEFRAMTKTGNVCDIMPWLQYFMSGHIKKLTDIFSNQVLLNTEQVQEHIESYDETNIRDISDILTSTMYFEEINDSLETSLMKQRLMHTMVDLLGAGLDTTVATLRWIIVHMMAYPEIQHNVFKEINNHVGFGRHVSIDDKLKLPYTEATMYEVMRQATISPFGVPHYTTHDTKVAGLDIDKGTVVLINLHSAEHDETIWGDPENFRPERFLLDNGEFDSEKLNNFFPFSVGRRKCVGETFAKIELFLMFATLMQKCSFSKPEDDIIDLDPVVGLTYYPKPYTVIVAERD